MYKKNKKSETIKTNKNIFIVIIVLAVVLIASAVILMVVNNKKDEVKNEKPEEEEKIYATEDSVEEEYHFSKEDAINSVKGIFVSDNYEFDATIREDNMYIVTVTNTENDSKYQYIVNPNDGSFELIDDEA